MHGRETFDKDRIHINVARLRKGGQTFEVVVDADQAVAFREGRLKDFREVVKSQEVFTDAKKGERAQESHFAQVFNTTDKDEVLRMILSEGEIQLTAEYRQKLRDAKKRQIITIIHRNGVAPQTHLPHPVTRLENAFDEAKVHLDEFRRAEDQVQDVLKSLRLVLPIKFELVEVALRIPAQHATRAYGTVKSYCKILRDEWLSDGTWSAVVELPAGLRDELFDELNRQTHGNVESRVVQTR